MAMNGAYRRDIGWGVFFLLFAITVWILVPSQIPDSGRTVMGPRFFPRVISIIMATVSIGLIISNVVKYHREKEKWGGEAKKWILDKENLRGEGRALLVFALMIVYAILMSWIGFIPASILATIIILFVLSARKWYFYAIVVAAVLLTYYLFKYQLYVQLP